MADWYSDSFQKTDLVRISDEGVKSAAQHVSMFEYKVLDVYLRSCQIHQRLQSESYTPRTWRTHPLHICPAEPYDPRDPLNKAILNWIFLISSLNFSFWSEKEGKPDRFGVLWREGWEKEGSKMWTGYWSLVASLNRGIQKYLFSVNFKPLNSPRSLGERYSNHRS